MRIPMDCSRLGWCGKLTGIILPGTIRITECIPSQSASFGTRNLRRGRFNSPFLFSLTLSAACQLQVPLQRIPIFQLIRHADGYRSLKISITVFQFVPGFEMYRKRFGSSRNCTSGTGACRGTKVLGMKTVLPRIF
jgi:hypothetical protein